MNEWVEPTKYPIPSPEEVRHELLGSNRFTKLDARDAFYMFLLTKDSQELFKFNTHIGVFMFQGPRDGDASRQRGMPRSHRPNARGTGGSNPDQG